MLKLLLPGNLDHQSNVAALEERQPRRRLKEELQAESVAVELDARARSLTGMAICPIAESAVVAMPVILASI